MTGDVTVVGGSGFIGSVLGSFLHARGYRLRVVTRNEHLRLPYPARIFCWRGDLLPAEACRGATAVVNLAGESLADGRWTTTKKGRIVSSRLETTRAVVNGLVEQPDIVLVQASAVGYYGKGFLAETARLWEAVVEDAPFDNRRLILRLGVVVGDDGGILPMLRRLYRWRLGACLGSGRQYFSWVHALDVCRFIDWGLTNRDSNGVYDLVAPQTATYRQFHRALCRPFNNPIPIPAWLLRLVLGEKADLVLDGSAIKPRRALAEGFTFKFSELDDIAQRNLASRV